MERSQAAEQGDRPGPVADTQVADRPGPAAEIQEVDRPEAAVGSWPLSQSSDAEIQPP